MAIEIKHHRCRREDNPRLAVGLFTCASKTSDEAADQLVLVERLDDIVITAHIEAVHNVLDGTAGSHKDDGHVGHFTQPATDFETIYIWHHYVEKNGIRVALVGGAQSSCGIIGHDDIKALVL